MAEKYERRALAIRQKQDPDSIDVAYSLRNLGKIARVRGDLVKADEYYHQALAIGEKIDPPDPSVTRFLVGLGYVARDRGDPVAAAAYYRRALDIMEKVAPDGLDHPETLADLAGALRDQHQLEAAAQMYRKALDELEGGLARLGGVDEDRSRYRALHDRYRREYVDVLMQQGLAELAFEVLERSRARTLREVLARANVNVRKGIDPSLIEKEKSLQKLRNSKSSERIRLLSNPHSEAQLKAVDESLNYLLEQNHLVEAEIRAQSPGYAALTQPAGLNASEIRKLLDGNTLLLEYSLGEPHSYVWAVTKNSLATYELPARAEIEAVARRVYRILSGNLDHGGTKFSEIRTEAQRKQLNKEYGKAAMQLSQMVLGPVAELLKDQRLVVVSDGALQFVPFTALPDPRAGYESSIPASEKTNIGVHTSPHPRSQESPEPLIVTHEIVSLPSVSVLAELRRQALSRPRPAKDVAVLADPVFSIADERLDTNEKLHPSGTQKLHLAASKSGPSLADQLARSLRDVGETRGGHFYLSRLLYTRKEADAIMSVTAPSRAMKAVDFQANRITATGPELAKYRIVHFATHGILNNEHPELSGLVLSLVNDRGQPQDGFLQLEDIYNLHLPVDLVVLSACDTALGQEMNGEGIVGLTRGFMYAGATRVIASLWSVNDSATSDLMARFYREMLQAQMRPAAALRSAQIRMWREQRWRNPYYWAAFQLYGDWN